MNKTTYILSACMMLGLTAAAQTPKQDDDNSTDRTIIVEKEYNPDINDADKINVLPRTERKSSEPKTAVQYATTPYSYDNRFEFVPMQLRYKPIGPARSRQTYIYAGYGNNGNADAGLYYNSPVFNNNEIKLDAIFDGINSKRKINELNDAEWNARYYRTDMAADYAHTFNIMKLYVHGGFGLDNFNYHPAFDLSAIDDKQRHTKADVKAGIVSNEGERLSYDISFAYSFFDKAYNFEADNAANRENQVTIDAGVGYGINDLSKIGVQLLMRNYTYTISNLKDYTTVTLHPTYSINNGNMNINLGVQLDMTANGRKRFNIAPDFRFDYTFAGKYNVYATAGGGRIDTGYRFLEMFNPYWNPNFMNKYFDSKTEQPIDLSNNYRQLEASIGFKGSPVEGLRFDIKGGFDANRGDLCLIADSKSQYSEMEQKETNVLYGQAEVSYAYKDRFRFSIAGKFMKWGNADAQFLALKPRYDINTCMDATIIDGLVLNLAYRSIGRTDKSVAGNINDLSARLSYTFFKGLGAYVRASNIISCDNKYYYAYPSAGASIVGGLHYTF